VRKVFSIIISGLLISCGGGGGGGTLVQNTPQVTTPTYSYESQLDLNTNGGSPNDVIGRVMTIRYTNDGANYSWLWQTTSGIELTFSQPDVNGVQSLKVDLQHDFRTDENPDRPFLNYESTFSSSEVTQTWSGRNFLFSDFSYDGIRITSIGFIDDAEPASYVSQGMTITNYDCEYFCEDSFLFDGWDLYKRDIWVMVAGDPTKSGDMPSSGSASYNVLGQMVVFGRFANGSYAPYYAQGDGSFSADFSARNLTGSMQWDDVAGCCGTNTDVRKANMTFGSTSFDGTISGVQFSGDVTWGDAYGTGSFSGGFFGPNASDIGGVFNIKTDTDNDDYLFGQGTFTGCKTC
tara:strand:+ start:194 stop:1237 length:1044 start_codon:yes stop_codon:yes gene_type:complete